MIFTKRARNLRRSQPFHEYVSRRPENDFNILRFRNLGGRQYLWNILIKIPAPVENCSSPGTDETTRGVKSEGEERRSGRLQPAE